MNIKSKASSAAALILGGITLSQEIITSPQAAEIFNFIKQGNWFEIGLAAAVVYLLWRDNPDAEKQIKIKYVTEEGEQK